MIITCLLSPRGRPCWCRGRRGGRGCRRRRQGREGAVGSTASWRWKILQNINYKKVQPTWYRARWAVGICLLQTQLWGRGAPPPKQPEDGQIYKVDISIYGCVSRCTMFPSGYGCVAWYTEKTMSRSLAMDWGFIRRRSAAQPQHARESTMPLSSREASVKQLIRGFSLYLVFFGLSSKPCA